MKIAAPFFGEFGWEVALWAPFLRARSEHEQMDVCCRLGHEHLYDDFAHTIYALPEPSGITKVDCQNVWHRGAKFVSSAMHAYLKDALVARRKGRLAMSAIIDASAMPVSWDKGPPEIQPHWHKPLRLAKNDKEKGWVAIHARDSLRNKGRNWSSKAWTLLLGELDYEHLIVVGATDQSMKFPGEDLRGRPLDEVCNALSRCEYIIGPSSGPMPLANYCGTRCVWWSPHPKDKDRYVSRTWNPFGIRNAQVATEWNPNPMDVLKAANLVMA